MLQKREERSTSAELNIPDCPNTLEVGAARFSKNPSLIDLPLPPDTLSGRGPGQCVWDKSANYSHLSLPLTHLPGTKLLIFADSAFQLLT